MGGISVLVVLGLFMSFYAFYLFIIFISVFYLFENYLFECAYLYKKEHSLIAWLPYYNKYLIGKQVNKEKEGIFLMDYRNFRNALFLSFIKCSIRLI